jgi:hypothetical protein
MICTPDTDDSLVDCGNSPPSKLGNPSVGIPERGASSGDFFGHSGDFNTDSASYE